MLKLKNLILETGEVSDYYADYYKALGSAYGAPQPSIAIPSAPPLASLAPPLASTAPLASYDYAPYPPTYPYVPDTMLKADPLRSSHPPSAASSAYMYPPTYTGISHHQSAPAPAYPPYQSYYPAPYPDPPRYDARERDRDQHYSLPRDPRSYDPRDPRDNNRYRDPRSSSDYRGRFV